MDRHTLRVLEFDKILALLAAKTRSETGRARALDLRPGSDPQGAERGIRLAMEAREALASGFAIPWETLPDLVPSLDRLHAEGARLEPEEFLELGRQLAAARALRAHFLAHADIFPLSAGTAERLTEHRELEKAIAATFDEGGAVRDDASPTLRRLRRERERVRAELEKKMQHLLRSSGKRDALQEEIVTIRNDRMVIPVKVERQGQVPGIVHDLSGSGHTVFVEPMETVPLNNRIREIAREEAREIERILLELSGRVRSVRAELALNANLLGAFDFEFAKGQMAEELDARAPLLRDDGTVRILGGRHPLLLATRLESRRKEAAGRPAAPGADPARALAFEEVVPLDFSLAGEKRAVIITGPNTGGKTVALKTIGLLTLMAQAGLPIPAAEGTELAVFRSVFADIGDEQSIELDLSTFSSHLRVIANVISRADANSLVLLDEIGAGTDPEEGAALAQAILENLLERDCRVIATTHHGSLKGAAHLDPRMENASLEFDAETLRTTYRFRQGVPGASRGIDIASRLGIPADTIERARHLVGTERVEFERLLADLERQLAKAREAGEEAAVARREAEALRLELAAREEDIRVDAREHRRRARHEAADVLREARALVEKLVEEIRTQQANRDSVREARDALDQLGARIDREERTDRQEARRERGRALDPAEIEPGLRVRVASMGREGIVLDPPSGGRVRVQAGSLRLEIPMDDLERIQPGEAAKDTERADHFSGSEAARRWARGMRTRDAVSHDARDVGESRGGGARRGGAAGGAGSEEESAVRLSETVGHEVDLRGLTAEEAIQTLDRYLDSAILAGLGEARIIHGKGTGVLRQRVQAYLRKHPRVREYRLGNWNEGGAGVTVAGLG